MNYKHLFFIVPIVLFCGGDDQSLFGQSASPKDQLNYTIEEITLPGGRLGNNVNCIVEGPNGYVWFGSHGGLHRYDGKRFITYKKSATVETGPSTDLSFPYVEWLHWTRDSMLWVATWGNGAYLFDPLTETFQHFPADEEDPTKLSHPQVNVITEDHLGQIWFGTNYGLNKWDDKKGIFEKFYHNPDDPKSLPDSYITSLYIDSKNDVWIGSGFAYFLPNDGGLSKLNDDGRTFTNYVGGDRPDDLFSSSVRGLHEDSNGNFWVGTTKALHKMNRDQGTFERMYPSQNQPYAPGMNQRIDPAVFSILEDLEGGLWIGTIMADGYESHLLRHDPLDQTNMLFPFSASVWNLCQSRDGTLWTAGAGISGKCFQIQKTSSEHKTLIHRRSVWFDSFYQSKLWKKIQIEYDRQVGLGEPYELAYDRIRNALWVKFRLDQRSAYDNHFVLALYDLENKAFQWYEIDVRSISTANNSAIPYDGLTAGMGIDQNGHVWGSLDNDDIGLYQLNPSTSNVKYWFHDSIDNKSLSSNRITSVYVDKKGNIWAGAYQNGVNMISAGSEELKRYPLLELNYANEINNTPLSFAEDSSGNVWTSGAIFIESTPTLLRMNPDLDTFETLLLSEPYNFEILDNIAVSEKTGDIAISLSSGALGFYDQEDWSFYSAASNSFPITPINGLISDQNGGFWAASGGYAAFAWFETPENLIYFETDEGTSGRNGRTAAQGSDGEVYFLNSEGPDLLHKDSFSVEGNINEVNISFVDLYVSGSRVKAGSQSYLERPLSTKKAIRLPYDVDNFGIAFSDMSFEDKAEVYQYRLLPDQDEWTTIEETMISFYRLAVGQYQLQLRPMAGSLSVLQISIAPPWWRTWWAYILYGMTLVFGGWLVHRYQKEKTIRLERERIKDRELEQAREIEKAYTQLKTTQEQLIHAEKMASLGELTAGIAHEIKNPLNFVNNFSEVNTELIDELADEIKKGHTQEVRELLNDIKSNEQKIQHHGKRADSIVKGMLMHSRNSNDEKVPTDINALADEYLRLAYHGLRAKDKSFNANMTTDFDQTLGQVSINPQDFGRVLLNLITNAFHACMDRQKIAENGYAPEVAVSTKNLEFEIEVKVRDNGNGIPQEVKGKIFQPFFTTKPTGEGTGLGLSMAFDIITKAHGGKLEVESEEGRGSVFIIRIPVS